jgi:hypothetical protein
MSDDGKLFVLTENNRVIAPQRSEFNYVKVTNQEGWEAAGGIKTFNGNLYLIDSTGNQIWKHRPGVNGFSPKTQSLETSSTGITDIGIDGGIYTLMNDGRILRYITGKSDNPRSIVINKVPGEYNLGSDANTQFFVRSNLSYIYILSGDRIWIFSPDTKRFQDISALNYTAQLELQTAEEIRSIFVPRDGTVYATTNLGVYEIKFEIVGGKLITR